LVGDNVDIISYQEISNSQQALLAKQRLMHAQVDQQLMYEE